MENQIPFTPFNNGLIIEHIEKKETKAGIILPDTVDPNVLMEHYEGDTVIAIGPNCKEVKVGDVVFFNPMAMPNGFKWMERKFLVFKEHEVVVIKK
jgi:co-chaperonin GroES (HSP10)